MSVDRGCATKDAIIKQLDLRLAQCQKEKEKYKKVQADIFPKIPDVYSQKIYWEMALRNGIISADAEIKWIKECLGRLGNN